MKIGLVRHFRVDIKRKPFMSSKEYDEYTTGYDIAEVIPNELVIDEEWDKCYCSSLSRAITTAKTVYHGEIIITDKLVEIPSKAWIKTNIRFHYNFWAWLGRFAWIRNHISQPEGRMQTVKRVNEIVDKILLEEKDKNILIVSHAGTIYEIQKILLRKGFRGDRFLKAKNGKLYAFQDK